MNLFLAQNFTSGDSAFNVLDQQLF